MKVEGSCHCGNITYEAVVDPDTLSICHCKDCQVLTGTAYRVSIPASAESLVPRGGRPKIYIKTAESGTLRAHAFCPECGSPIYASAITIQRAIRCVSEALSNERDGGGQSGKSGAARRYPGQSTFARLHNQSTVNSHRLGRPGRRAR